MVITIDPGDNWNTKLAGPRSADTITVTIGNHMNVQIDSGDIEDNDIFILNDGVIIDGGRTITGFTYNATYDVWQHTGETGGPTSASQRAGAPGGLASQMLFGSQTRSGRSARGNYFIEDLFVNDKPLRQFAFVDLATTLPSLQDWEWTWDGAGNVIYVRMNNLDQEVVTISSDHQPAIDLEGTDGVVVTWEGYAAMVSGPDNLDNYTNDMPIIQKYATNVQVGAVHTGLNCLFGGFRLRFNHGYGLRGTGPNNWAIDKLIIEWNGQMGIGAAHGDNWTETNVILRYNNFNELNWGWEAGGQKMTNSIGGYVSACWASFNLGAPFWWDIGNRDSTNRHLWANENSTRGVYYEISPGPVYMRYCYMKNNGKNWDGITFPGDGQGMQLLVTNVENGGHCLYSETRWDNLPPNTGTTHGDGIGIHDDGRFTAWGGTRNMKFLHNIVSMDSGSSDGFLAGINGQGSGADGSGTGNIIDYSTYYFHAAESTRWYPNLSWVNWKAKAFSPDANGTITWSTVAPDRAPVLAVI